MPRTSAASEKSVSNITGGKPQRMKAKSTHAPQTIGNGCHREEMIAVAAYFLAEHRGFNGGDPVADWLEAEAEVDAMLGNTPEPSSVH